MDVATLAQLAVRDNSQRPLAFISKSSILDVWQDSEYAVAFGTKYALLFLVYKSYLGKLSRCLFFSFVGNLYLFQYAMSGIIFTFQNIDISSLVS